jgi:hypothetical protein
LFIAATIEHLLHCLPLPPLPSSIAAIRRQSLLSPPAAGLLLNTIFVTVIFATTVDAIKNWCHDLIPPLATTVINCHHQTLLLNATAVSVVHRRYQRLTPAVNNRHHQIQTPTIADQSHRC